MAIIWKKEGWLVLEIIFFFLASVEDLTVSLWADIKFWKDFNFYTKLLIYQSPRKQYSTQTETKLELAKGGENKVETVQNEISVGLFYYS